MTGLCVGSKFFLKAVAVRGMEQEICVYAVIYLFKSTVNCNDVLRSNCRGCNSY